MAKYVDKVDLPNFWVHSPEGTIQDTIDYTRDYANTMREQLDEALEALIAAVGDFTPGDIPGSSIGEIGSPNPPNKPTIDGNFVDFPDTTIPDPVIKDIDADFSFIDPLAPDEIDPSFDYTPGVYSSCIWDTLCDKIKDDLINGGTGLTDAVYGAILDRNAEARREAEDTSRRRALDSVGARGHDLPGGMAAAVTMEIV